MNTMEDFVEASIAIDKAWLAGTLNQTLDKIRKEEFDGFGISGEDGNMEGEATSELDAD